MWKPKPWTFSQDPWIWLIFRTLFVQLFAVFLGVSGRCRNIKWGHFKWKKKWWWFTIRESQWITLQYFSVICDMLCLAWRSVCVARANRGAVWIGPKVSLYIYILYCFLKCIYYYMIVYTYPIYLSGAADQISGPSVRYDDFLGSTISLSFTSHWEQRGHEPAWSGHGSSSWNWRACDCDRVQSNQIIL